MRNRKKGTAWSRRHALPHANVWQQGVADGWLPLGMGGGCKGATGAALPAWVNVGIKGPRRPCAPVQRPDNIPAAVQEAVCQA
jgi:hypothetical protein